MLKIFVMEGNAVSPEQRVFCAAGEMQEAVHDPAHQNPLAADLLLEAKMVDPSAVTHDRCHVFLVLFRQLHKRCPVVIFEGKHRVI